MSSTSVDGGRLHCGFDRFANTRDHPKASLYLGMNFLIALSKSVETATAKV